MSLQEAVGESESAGDFSAVGVEVAIPDAGAAEEDGRFECYTYFIEAVVVGEVEAAVGHRGDVVGCHDLGISEGFDVLHARCSGLHLE